MPPSENNQPNIDLDSIRAPETVSIDPDPKTQEEAESLDAEAHTRKLGALEIEGVKQDLAQ